LVEFLDKFWRSPLLSKQISLQKSSDLAYQRRVQSPVQLSSEDVEGVCCFEHRFGTNSHLAAYSRHDEHFPSEPELHHGLVDLFPLVAGVKSRVPFLVVAQLRPADQRTDHCNEHGDISPRHNFPHV